MKLLTKRSLLLLVLLCACQYDPFAHEYTTARPAEADLIGTYRPDRETSARIKGELAIDVSRACELTLRPDGTFEIRDLPNCWFVSSAQDCAAGAQDVSGIWRLRQQQRWWAVELTRQSTRNGVNHDYRVSPVLRGSEPPYLLHFIIGDPDSGNALAFAREESVSTRR